MSFSEQIIKKLIQLCQKGEYIIAICIIQLYLFKYFSPTFYLGFIFGFINCIALQLALFWKLTFYQIDQYNKRRKSTINFIKDEIIRFLGPRTLDQIEDRNKKLNYFINDFSSENQMITLKQMIENDKQPIKLIEVEQDQQQNVSSNVNQTKSKSVVSPERNLQISTNLNQDIFQIQKIQSKQFTTKISSFAEFLNGIIDIETMFGKSFEQVGILNGFFSQQPDRMIFISDSVDKTAIFPFKQLEEENEKYANLIKSNIIQFNKQKTIQLPQWSIFRSGYHQLGKIHLNCSQFLKDGDKSFADMLLKDYEAAYLNLKKERKWMQQKMIQSIKTLKNLSRTYDTMMNNQKSLLQKFQEVSRKRDNPQIIHKLEYDIKLQQNELDSLASKVHNAQDIIVEDYKVVNQMNTKIEQFKRLWENKRIQLFSTILKSIQNAYSEVVEEKQYLFKDILNYNYILTQETLKDDDSESQSSQEYHEDIGLLYSHEKNQKNKYNSDNEEFEEESQNNKNFQTQSATLKKQQNIANSNSNKNNTQKKCPGFNKKVSFKNFKKGKDESFEVPDDQSIHINELKKSKSVQLKYGLRSLARQESRHIKKQKTQNTSQKQNQGFIQKLLRQKKNEDEESFDEKKLQENQLHSKFNPISEQQNLIDMTNDHAIESLKLLCEDTTKEFALAEQNINDSLKFLKQICLFQEEIFQTKKYYFKKIQYKFKVSQVLDHETGNLLELWLIVKKNLSIYCDSLEENLKEMEIIYKENQENYEQVEKTIKNQLIQGKDYLKIYKSHVNQYIKKHNNCTLDNNLTFKSHAEQDKQSFLNEIKNFLKAFDQFYLNKSIISRDFKINIILRELNSTQKQSQILLDFNNELNYQFEQILAQEIQMEEQEEIGQQFQLENQQIDRNFLLSCIQDKIIDKQIELSSPLRKRKDTDNNITLLQDKNIQSIYSPMKEDQEGDLANGDFDYGAKLLTRMLSVFFNVWSTNERFQKEIIFELEDSFNKKRSFEKINIIKVTYIKVLLIYQTHIITIRLILLDLIQKKFTHKNLVNSNYCQFLYDLVISYRGKFFMELETDIHLKFLGTYKIKVQVLVKSLNGRIRICWVPKNYGRSWYSFIGEPVLNIDINPLLGEQQIDMNQYPYVQELVRNVINSKLQKMTHPNKKGMPIPLTKIINKKI